MAKVFLSRCGVVELLGAQTVPGKNQEAEETVAAENRCVARPSTAVLTARNNS